ncbi:MAG TPA: glycosyl hydrolase [Paludibacter sp.]|nr:glycosyl hydrolase [Paludibacter sp.]
MQSNIHYIFLIFILLILSSCNPDEPGDTVAPTVMLTTPEDKATNVDINTQITIQFTEKIVLAANPQIKLNGALVNATVNARTITISAVLQSNTSYTLVIPGNAVSDVSGNFAKEIMLTFTTAKTITVEGTLYEAEAATLAGDAVMAQNNDGFSGSGYVNTNTGNVNFTIQASETGYYDIYFRFISNGQKVNLLYVDGKQAAEITFSNSLAWTEVKAAMLKLSTGSHTISIVKSWGYIQLDYLRIAKNTAGPVAFNIVSSPVTPNPSAQLTNLYNYLKTNFGTKIISGAMAAHSTNINEAVWIHDNTGKWPAFTFFDFIDHTNPNQNWIKYNDPFTLGQEWWNNNGVVGFSWHWRDPLTKSGSFNTSETSFDITKVTDTNSAEYKAMIVDIDVIAGYLKPFKNANIPVIWRPLHEAEGTWFWWGAKGAEPCKTLWKLLFERLVNYHGLNNLIWVWTTSVSANAANWYPGDGYVDVLGMDIYPGENQHGSQYISFNKVREFTGGKKIITLSECGSVPDPALMMENGDAWSWFMPWNSDYTRSDSHNGIAWWKKFFSYDYVVTRDKMPSLK